MNGGRAVIADTGGVVRLSPLAARLQRRVALVDVTLLEGDGLDLAAHLSLSPVPVGIVLVSSDSV